MRQNIKDLIIWVLIGLGFFLVSGFFHLSVLRADIWIWGSLFFMAVFFIIGVIKQRKNVVFENIFLKIFSFFLPSLLWLLIGYLAAGNFSGQ